MAASELLILAGPNGAGKTTFAYAQLRNRIDAGLFLNADETAREMAPDNVESAAFAAARALLERLPSVFAYNRALSAGERGARRG